MQGTERRRVPWIGRKTRTATLGQKDWSMNPWTIKRLFKNASASVLAANAGDYGTPHDDNHNSKVSDTEPQRDQAPALGKAISGEAQGINRPRIRFVGYRVRPLDPDNFAGSVKDLLDGLAHANLIPGDATWQIILETEQVKVSTFKDERTEVTIIYP